MTEEIKILLDILNKVKDYDDKRYFISCGENDYLLTNDEIKALLNYITNLQKENEEFYQLMEMQNKREYRSKFLKDFQKEHGKNVIPDYDEIYKRYDDYKSRNEKAIEYIKENTDKLKTTRIPKIDFNYNELLNILQGGDEE